MWTYSGNPKTSAKDEVRFLIQDTDPANPLVKDEEIAYLLGETDSVLKAAHRLALILAARYAKAADVAIGDYRISLSSIAKSYEDLALRLQRRLALAGALPYAGGIQLSEKIRREGDLGRVRPSFSRGLFDYAKGEG